MTSLAAAIESRDWSNWYAWAGPEAGALKTLRTRLRDEFGFPKQEIHAQAYWTEGRAMGTKRGDDDGRRPPHPPTPAAAPADAPPRELARAGGGPAARAAEDAADRLRRAAGRCSR